MGSGRMNDGQVLARDWKTEGKQSGSVSECGKPSLLSHLILLWWCPMVSVFRQEREREGRNKKRKSEITF